MQEYVTDAVVLNKDPVRDADARYSFFTKRFGKIVAKATSTRKITSKLAGHLEPGTVAQIRIVEKHGAQLVDALKSDKLTMALPDLRFLNLLLAEGEPEPALWAELVNGNFSWPRTLRILGWDPEGGVCEQCGKKIAAFYLTRQEFFCAACASKLDRNALLLLNA